MSGPILALRAAILSHLSGDAELATLMGGTAKSGSAKTALAAAERMADLLHDASLALAGHGLVLIRATAIEGDRDDKTNLARAKLRLRALTEVT